MVGYDLYLVKTELDDNAIAEARGVSTEVAWCMQSSGEDSTGG